ncbi:MAG: signal peptidase II [Burkholderiales bacterium]|nr:signal peptidase II [Burkholderiales bacterium]
MVKTKPKVRFSWIAVLLWFLFAIALAIVDQWTKDYMQSKLIVGDVQRVTEFFNLTMAYNPGAAFSFLADAGGWQRGFFSIIAAVATVVLSFLIGRNSKRFWFCLGLALIISGALGNALDRVRLGVVIDFLDFHALGYHWPAFNFADSCICVGAFLVILAEIFGNWKKQ